MDWKSGKRRKEEKSEGKSPDLSIRTAGEEEQRGKGRFKRQKEGREGEKFMLMLEKRRLKEGKNEGIQTRIGIKAVASV